MRIKLPLVFDVTLDEAALQDMQIDFGAAEARHLRGVDWSGGFPSISEDAIKAFMSKLEARQSLWKLLDQSVTVASDSPARLKALVCLSALCQLFNATVHIASASLTHLESGANWLVEARLTDRNGKFLANGFAGSLAFQPDDHCQSLSAFFGAVVDAVRECALQAFLVNEARDDQDVR